MPAFPGFVNGSATARALTWDSERTINWYVEGKDAGTPKSGAYLASTPGLSPFVGAGAGPVRANFWQDGQGFAVSGAYFLEYFQSQTATALGVVRADNRPATICSNGQAGTQLFIVSAGLGYIYDLDAQSFVQITDTNFPAFCSSGLFFDQYFMALDRQTGEVFFSDLDDGLTWSGLDFFAESQFSDTVKAFAPVHDNIWLFGSKHTGPWYNSGGANNTFVPVPGSVMEQGIVGEGWSVATLDNTVFWLAKNAQGQGIVFKASGYTPSRISTHPIETYLNQYYLDDAIGFAYQEEGHLFYVLNVPTMPTTLVYDVASDLWCERGHWNTDTMQYEPWRPRCHAYGFGQHLFGDRASGTIYQSSLTQFIDRLVG